MPGPNVTTKHIKYVERAFLDDAESATLAGSPTLGPVGLVATVAGGLALTLLGAGLATAGVLAVSPTSLLAPSEAPTGGETDG